MAFIWDLEKNCRGKLIQGYMLRPNYLWDFPLSQHRSEIDRRQGKILNALSDVRQDRDSDRTYKKQAQIAAMKYGNMQSSLGFGGAALLGLDFEMQGMTVSSGVHTKPSSYKMSKQQDSQN
mmetsp:Transcript_7833/g.12137  ORF Transcript_7833/g.12137 Transcript_7833/m.12137 type:complete len:121 (-) Transcript_7833:526-888(-)